MREESFLILLASELHRAPLEENLEVSVDGVGVSQRVYTPYEIAQLRHRHGRHVAVLGILFSCSLNFLDVVLVLSFFDARDFLSTAVYVAWL